MNILIEQFHNRFIVEPTKYSYLVTDRYTKENIELNSLLFTEGRKPFIVNALNRTGDPFIYLKISYSNYITFLEYTNSKADFAFKTNKLSILTSSQLKFDLNSANELVIQHEDLKQVVRLNDLKKFKDTKLQELFNSYVNTAIFLKLNNKLYVINKHNDKLSIKLIKSNNYFTNTVIFMQRKRKLYKIEWPHSL